MKVYILLLTTLALCGCATVDTSKLRLGMTKDQVVQTLGKPFSTASGGKLEQLNYDLDVTTQITIHYIVQLEEGKVVAFGERCRTVSKAPYSSGRDVMPTSGTSFWNPPSPRP